MKIGRFLTLLLATILISFLVTNFIYNITVFNNRLIYRDVKIGEVLMDLTVPEDNSYGINIDNDALHFGKLPVGASATRRVNITNDYDFKVLLYIKKDGSELSNIVSIGPSNIILESFENTTITASVTVPEGFAPGNYSGKVEFVIRVPFYMVS